MQDYFKDSKKLVKKFFSLIDDKEKNRNSIDQELRTVINNFCVELIEILDKYLQSSDLSELCC